MVFGAGFAAGKYTFLSPNLSPNSVSPKIIHTIHTECGYNHTQAEILLQHSNAAARILPLRKSLSNIFFFVRYTP